MVQFVEIVETVQAVQVVKIVQVVLSFASSELVQIARTRVASLSFRNSKFEIRNLGFFFVRLAKIGVHYVPISHNLLGCPLGNFFSMIQGQQPVGYPETQAQEVINDEKSHSTLPDSINQLSRLFHSHWAEASDYFVQE